MFDGNDGQSYDCMSMMYLCYTWIAYMWVEHEVQTPNNCFRHVPFQIQA